MAFLLSGTTAQKLQRRLSSREPFLFPHVDNSGQQELGWARFELLPLNDPSVIIGHVWYHETYDSASDTWLTHSRCQVFGPQTFTTLPGNYPGKVTPPHHGNRYLAIMSTYSSGQYGIEYPGIPYRIMVLEGEQSRTDDPVTDVRLTLSPAIPRTPNSYNPAGIPIPKRLDYFADHLSAVPGGFGICDYKTTTAGGYSFLGPTPYDFSPPRNGVLPVPADTGVPGVGFT